LGSIQHFDQNKEISKFITW